jgi:hypothetical protein
LLLPAAPGSSNCLSMERQEAAGLSRWPLSTPTVRLFCLCVMSVIDTKTAAATTAIQYEFLENRYS